MCYSSEEEPTVRRTHFLHLDLPGTQRRHHAPSCPFVVSQLGVNIPDALDKGGEEDRRRESVVGLTLFYYYLEISINPINRNRYYSNCPEKHAFLCSLNSLSCS